MDSIELVFFPRADGEFICLEITSLKLLVPCFFSSAAICSRAPLFRVEEWLSHLPDKSYRDSRSLAADDTHFSFYRYSKKNQTRIFFSRGSSSVSGEKKVHL